MNEPIRIVQNSYWDEEPLDNIYAIPSSHPAIPKSQKLKEEIAEVLRRSQCKSWLVVLVLNGEQEETAKPTILVVADKKVDFPYESKYGIKIKFEEDNIGRFSPANADNAQYEQPIKAGSSCSGEDGNAGTVGGFYTLQDGSIVGLTNMHVLESSKSHEGRVHQPAISDYKYSIKMQEALVKNLKKKLALYPFMEPQINKARTELADYKNLQKSGGFICGNYIHGRDERNPGQTTLDYSIFSIDPGRPNPTNDLSAVRPKYPSRLKPLKRTLDVMAAECALVFKVGRSSGFTIGKLNPEMALAKMNDIETMEYAVVGISQKMFADGGDSGSIVCEDDGSICGLVWGGCEKRNLSFVTPLDMVFRSLHEDGYELTLSED